MPAPAAACGSWSRARRAGARSAGGGRRGRRPSPAPGRRRRRRRRAAPRGRRHRPRSPCRARRSGRRSPRGRVAASRPRRRRRCGRRPSAMRSAAWRAVRPARWPAAPRRPAARRRPVAGTAQASAIAAKAEEAAHPGQERRLSPVISGGWSTPMSASSVGARSARRPSWSVAPGGPADEDHRDRVQGVGGVRAAGRGIDHHLAVAVVGGDDASRRPCPRPPAITCAEAGVDRLDRLDRRLEDAGVADHVGVGVVADEQRVVAGTDRGDQMLGHLGGGHLRRRGRRCAPWGSAPCSAPRPRRGARRRR